MLRQDEYSGTIYRLDYITENYNDRVANADLTPMDTSYYTSYRPSFEMDTPETVGGFVITDFCQTASYCVLPDYDAIACSLDCPQP